MTEEQKSKAIFYMAGQHRVYRSNHRRFMEDGDQIRFTKVINDGMNNQEYEINDCEDWSMWFSQLSQIHITQDIDDLYASTIKFLDGNKFSIHAMEACEFYEKVKGKTFKVSVCPSFAAFKPSPYILEDTYEAYCDVLDDVKNWKPAPAAPAAPAAEEDPKTKASPLAAAVAKDLGIDLDKIGAKDRVLAEDILRYLESTREKAPEEAPREEVVPMNGIRKAIAKNMLNSHMTSPTVTVKLSVDMSAMKAYREQLKAKEIKVSYTDLLVKFIAKALTEFPLLNCSVEDNKIVYKHYVNMGVAVALDNGLVVPNVPDADKKSLTEISKEIKELAKLAREGGLPMEKLRGGTFTITNLGMYGIESFTPIINQPEVAILGVTTMEDRAVVRGGEIVIRPMMTLSLTFDHRVVDGSVAAEFLQRVKALLENPALMLA
jgi:pyruvate/2-oxoglutarate dehydrogenase complex dihydrolipoamide acyltransferase (E2) component